MRHYAIDGIEEIKLHHFYRAMGWLGGISFSAPDHWTHTPRRIKDDIEEQLFSLRRDLFSDLSMVFFDTTSLYFEGEGGVHIGQFDHSKDHRPDLKLVVVGVILDNEGNPICSEIVPGNTTDVTTLIPVAQRLKSRFGIEKICVVKDALGRKWQLGTIQVDYNLPERFELEYIGADNQKHRPVMIHRAPFGSMERFVAVLLEHTAGNFPLWLTPDQAIILPISEKYQDYANKVLNLLNNSEIRSRIDNRNEKAGKKIRDAELSKIPYMLVVGDREANEGTVSVRKHSQGDLGPQKIEEFIDYIKAEVNKELGEINQL